MAPTYETRFIPRIVTSEGSAAAPAFVCPSDADTGLWWAPSGKALLWGVDGVRTFSLSSGGPNCHGFGTPPALSAYRANGTEESPTVAGDTAILFQFSGYGYDGAAYVASPGLRFYVDGTPSIGIVPGGIKFLARNDSGVQLEALTIRATGTTEIRLGLAHQGSTLGFFNTTPTTKPTITGSRGGNAALADLLTKLAGLGLLTDSTSEGDG